MPGTNGKFDVNTTTITTNKVIVTQSFQPQKSHMYHIFNLFSATYQNHNKVNILRYYTKSPYMYKYGGHMATFFILLMFYYSFSGTRKNTPPASRIPHAEITIGITLIFAVSKSAKGP